MSTLPSMISDDRVDPFTGVEKPRLIRLPTSVTPQEVHDCRLIPEQGWNGIKLFEEPQPPAGAEVPADKLKLWQESAPGSGNYNVQFIQVDVSDEPSSGQFKVAWGSGTGLIKMNAADLSDTTGKDFAVEYDGLGTIAAALYHLVLPPGSFTWFWPNIAGAWSITEMRQLGWAVMDGTTAVSQGILDPIINAVLPDLIGPGAFMRAATIGAAGAFQGHAIQYHHHAKDLSHGHNLTDPGHGHTSPAHDHTYQQTAAVGGGPASSGTGAGNQTGNTDSVAVTINSSPTGATVDSQALTGGDLDPTDSPSGAANPVQLGDETRPNNYGAVPLLKVK